jgi:hypothetical protein
MTDSIDDLIARLERATRLVCGPVAVAICAGCIGLAAAVLARTSKDSVKVTLAPATQSPQEKI